MIKKFSIFLIALLFPPIIFSHSETQVIEILPSAFEPSEVTVDQNATIIFLNKDTQARHPASNIHPTHTIYPEFDPKRPIDPGQSWTFKPKKLGTWKYHDHLLPHIRGTITVVSEAGQAQTYIWQQNFKDFIEAIIFKIKSILSPTKKEDAAKKWEDLKQKYNGEAGSSGDIHDQAHLAGSLLYQEKGFGGIGLCSPDFAFGCFHGFLDQAFKKDLSKLIDAQKSCSNLGPGLTGPVASCIHGIGHGVASFYETSDLKSALLACDNLSSGQTYCHDGVFMEFARNASKEFYKEQDPLFPCSGLDEKYVFSCGRNQPQVLIQRFQLSFNDVVNICFNAQSQNFKDACFDALGFHIVSTSNGDADFIVRECMKIADEDGRLRCTKSAAGELIFQNIPGWQVSSAAVCQSLPPTSQNSCFEYIENIKRDYGRL